MALPIEPATFSTQWLLLPLIVSAVAMSHMATTDGWLGRHRKTGVLEDKKRTDDLSSAAMRVVAIACNFVLLGFTCWAFVDQYPHPSEEGLVA